MSRLSRPVVALVVLALLAAAALALTWSGTRTVTATFPQAVNLHAGDEVRMLGVKVGTVESVTPRADRVVVEMSYDDDYRLADDATAALVTPTLVSVRYVQLGPLTERGGLADGARIPAERTAVPIEWDETKAELDRLAEALGPRGDRETGALGRVVEAGAANVDGQGVVLRDSLQQLAGTFETLARGGDDLFSVVRNLQTFVTALAENDRQVGEFNRRLADVSGVLADNKDDLGTLLETLDRSSGVIDAFLADHRREIAASVGDLRDVTKTLSDSRQALADILQRAPTGVSNLHNIYDPFSRSVTTSVAATNFNDPSQFLCDVVSGPLPEGTPSTESRTLCQTTLGPLLDILKLPYPPVGVNGIERDPKEAPQ